MKSYKEILESKKPSPAVLKKLGLKPGDVSVISTAGNSWLLQASDVETVMKAWEFAKKNVKGKWKKGYSSGMIATDGGRIPDIEFDWNDLFISFPKDFK